MVLNTLEKDETVLSIDNFKWLVNSQENRSNFLNYSVELLANIQKQAIADWEFEVAAFIRDVLSDKDKLWETNEKNNEKIEENISDVKNQLTDVLSKDDNRVQPDRKVEANESEKLDWEYLQLWNKQNEVAKKIESYFVENWIMDNGGYPIRISPKNIEFDGDTIIVNNTWENYFFKLKNGQLEEIPLISDKIVANTKIRNVYKVWNCYKVELCFLNGNWWDRILYYYINKDWEYVPEFGEQTWNENFYKSGFWSYECDVDIPNSNKIVRKIYNEKMVKLAEFEDEKEIAAQKYVVQYCDDDCCIFWIRKDSVYPEYMICDKTWKLWEWKISDLQRIEYVKRFQKILDQNEDARKKYMKFNSIPFEERFMEKNHCKIIYNNDEKTDVSICNDKWDLLYNFWDVVGHDFNENRPEFYTKQGDTIRLNNWSTDNNVLFIEVIKYNRGMGNSKKKSLFIDKITWDKKEFEWFQWEYSFQFWKLAEVYYTWEDAEIYDESLNLLWNRLRSDSNLYAVSRQESWEVKTYLYSQKTWKVVCEIDWTKWLLVIKNVYEDGDWKSHYIIEQKDGTLCEVTP